MLVIKTEEERIPELRDVLLSRHPSDMPEFILPVTDAIEDPYRQWLIESISPR